MELVLLPNQQIVGLQTVTAVHPTAPLIACDFYIEGIEKGNKVPGGFQIGRVLNIDHHAPVSDMARVISSTNLAITRIRKCGLPTPETRIIITHTDCDSILSAAIISGRVLPDDDLGEAALAADHRGEANSVADLLQGLQIHRDVELSIRNLQLLLQGSPVEGLAEAALHDRQRKRALAAKVAAQFNQVDKIFYLTLSEDIDTEFFPALLPRAVLILTAVPNPQDCRRSFMKLRLGSAAPPGFSINHLKVPSFDYGYGGRWNAGANKRAGGTTMTVEEYAQTLARSFQSCEYF